MAILKVQSWRPDTHAGHVVEVEWEYDVELGCDTGREHRGISVLYPDGTLIHRDTHGDDLAHEHYRKLSAEHVVKNHAYNLILESLPAHMKKPLIDSDGDAILDDYGEACLAVKDKHKPTFKHLGADRYEFIVPGIDEAAYNALAKKLTQLGNSVILLKPGL